MPRTTATSLVEGRIAPLVHRRAARSGAVRRDVVTTCTAGSKSGARGVRVDADAGWHAWSPAFARLERVRAAAESPVTAASVAQLAADLADLAAIDGVEASGLSVQDRLLVLRAWDRLAAWSQAGAAAALATYAGPQVGDVEGDRHLRLEVRIARGTSDPAAGNDIAAARDLADHALPVRDLWSRGEIGFRHVAAVLDRTAGLDPELAAAVVETVVDRLPRTPAPRVRGLVTRTIARLEPRAAAQRAAVARRHEVGVAFRSLPDGLGQVIATLPVESARAVMERTDAGADVFLDHQRGCADCTDAVPAEIGPARAHVLLQTLGLDRHGNELPTTDTGAGDAQPATASAASTAGTASAAGAAGRGRASRRRGELQVVIDLATLLGLAQEPGLLNGQPVPAAIARELAGSCGSMRRIVTDPADGHLLDYGTRTYLPDALRTFVTARDGTCRSPGCGQPAARSQLDHVVPFPHGPSDVANTHTLCKRDHDTKTAGHLRITSHAADGTATWRTEHGQTGATPPRPYLNDPTDEIPPY